MTTEIPTESEENSPGQAVGHSTDSTVDNPVQSSETKYPRRTLRKMETRKRIIRSAVLLLGEGDVSAITMAIVADRADVHVTTLFTHFDSKSDLLSALSEPVIKNLEESVHASIGNVPFFVFMRKIQLQFSEQIRDGGSQAISDALFWRGQWELVPAWLKFERRQIELFADYLKADLPITRHQARLVAGMIVSANICSFDEWLDNPTGISFLDAYEENITEIEMMVRKSFLEQDKS